MIVDEPVEEFSCDVSFEATDDVLFGESFVCTAGNVIEGWLMPTHP